MAKTMPKKPKTKPKSPAVVSGAAGDPRLETATSFQDGYLDLLRHELEEFYKVAVVNPARWGRWVKKGRVLATTFDEKPNGEYQIEITLIPTTAKASYDLDIVVRKWKGHRVLSEMTVLKHSAEDGRLYGSDVHLLLLALYRPLERAGLVK